MTRAEVIARSAEMRLDRILEQLRGPKEEADPLVRFADPEPPRDVTLPGWRRRRWVRRLMGR